MRAVKDAFKNFDEKRRVLNEAKYDYQIASDQLAAAVLKAGMADCLQIRFGRLRNVLRSKYD